MLLPIQAKVCDVHKYFCFLSYFSVCTRAFLKTIPNCNSSLAIHSILIILIIHNDCSVSLLLYDRHAFHLFKTNRKASTHFSHYFIILMMYTHTCAANCRYLSICSTFSSTSCRFGKIKYIQTIIFKITGLWHMIDLPDFMCERTHLCMHFTSFIDDFHALLQLEMLWFQYN